MPSIKGRFCERNLASKRRFDRRSFRWIRSGRNWMIVGCPKGKWSRGRCSAGTRGHKILVRSKPSGKCCPKARTGERCVLK